MQGKSETLAFDLEMLRSNVDRTDADYANERRDRLNNLEGVIKRVARAFVDVGEALEEIRDKRLYEGRYDNFDTYCMEEYGWTPRHADRQIRASIAARKLRPIGLNIRNEAQARELARLADAPEIAKRLWERAGKRNGGKVTAAGIREAFESEFGTTKPAPPRQGDQPAPVSRGPGSKWRMAPRIIDLFPVDFRVYVEPYVGTGAMLLSKEPSEVEIVNDKHEEISNLFDVIRDRSKELARVVDRSGFTEADLLRAYHEDPAGLDLVERARRWLVLAHQSFLRQTGQPFFSVSTAPSARNSIRLWDELPKHIEAASRRLKKVKVMSREAVEVIEMDLVKKPDVLLYVDPPYLPGTRAKNLYVHEMSVKDHEKLLDALTKHPGPVFLSGYKSAIYSDRLGGWEARDLPGYSSYGGREEVLWMNGKAAAGARAADKRAAKAERLMKAPAASMGMVYQPPPDTEAPAFAAVFGALLEGWHEGEEE